MDDMIQIRSRVNEDEVLIILEDDPEEPHERVRGVFDDTDALEVYVHHHMRDCEIARSRVETHSLWKSKAVIRNQ